MSRILLVLSLAIFFTLTSCEDNGSGATKSTKRTVKIEQAFPLSIQNKGYTQELSTIRAQARTLIDHRAETADGPYAMMTVGYWYPEFVFNSGTMSKEFQYEGYWIKYNDDFSYEYGKYEDEYGSGRYHFRLDDKSLLLVDDDIEKEPKSFTANYNGDVMAYIGKHDYGVNNGMQIKMVPIDTKPIKS